MTASTIPGSLRRPLTVVARLDLARRFTGGAAGVVVFLVFLLLAFVAWNGIQIVIRAGVPLSDVFSTRWAPDSASAVSYGIVPFIAGTVGVMVVGALIATPLSVGLALFMAEIAPRWARSITQPAMEVFVGIPSQP